MKKTRNRKNVLLSIRSKILLLSFFITFLSLSVFFYFSTNLFTEDKEVYLYESVLNSGLNLSNLVSDYQQRSFDRSKIVVNILISLEGAGDRLLNHTINTDKKTIGLIRLKGSIVDRSIFNEFALKSVHLKSDQIIIASQEFGYDKEVLRRDKYTFDFIKVADQLLSRVLLYNEGDIYAYFENANDLGSAFSISSFSNLLIDNKLNLILNSKDKKISSNKQLHEKIKSFFDSKMDHGVSEIKVNGVFYLLSYSKIPIINFLVISLSEKSKIYTVIDKLKKKTLYFTFFLLSVAVSLGTLLARNVSIPIGTLVEGTKELARGNFQHEIIVTSRDELRLLSYSFNDMSSQIVKYMEQEKDKVRMEEELAVAQLVQSSFFPSEDLMLGNMSVSGFYESASECGGDWWRAVEIENKTLLFIGDATGHGVPPALITATVNACANVIENLAQKKKSLLHDPSKIMTLMNDAVFKVGGKILMTFFIGIYDSEKRLITYTNASHNPPFLYKFDPENEPAKKDLKLLMDNNGPRLGHVENPKYEASQLEMTSNDVLLLYTDGIIEAENSDGKQFGERRFIKSFLQEVLKDPKSIKENILKNAISFYGNVRPDDDVTLVVAKRNVDESV